MFEPSAKPRTRFSSLLFVFGPLAFIAWCWWPGISAPYQYDDFVTPLKDPASQSLSSFVHALPGTLRPLTKLSYALESSVGLVDAPQRRVLQGLLFWLAAALVARLLRDAGLGAFFAASLATLWAVHPVHAETLIALAGRSVLLALCLTLASVSLLLRGHQKAAVCLALLAVLARETALPWLVVCAGWSASKAGFSRGKIAAWMLTAILLGCALIFSSARMRTLLDFAWDDPAALHRLGLQWAALPRGIYLWLSAPSAFSVDMDFAPQGLSRALYVLLACALYAGAVFVALRKAYPTPLRVFATLWLCLVLPLHSVFPKLDPLTARSVSASSAAATLLLATAATTAFSFTKQAQRLAAFGGALVLALLVPLTRTQATLYQDPVALWRNAALRSEHSLRPLLNLGTLLAQRDRLQEAEEAFTAAVRRDPRNSEARAKLAALHTLKETKRLLRAPDTD